MIADAEAHAQSDKVRRALIEAANEGDMMCDDIEKGK